MFMFFLNILLLDLCLRQRFYTLSIDIFSGWRFAMSCCNKPPRGGSDNIGLLVKVFLIMFVVMIAIAFIFG